MTDPTGNVIVTGASSGVGRAAARLLADAGYRVVLAGRTASTLHATAAVMSDRRSVVVPTDVTDPEGCRNLVACATADGHRLDALINVAGYATLTPIDDITAAAWRTTIDTNLTSVVMLTAAAWPFFRDQREGLIVNISSMAGLDPFPKFAMYASAKAAVNMFTTAAAGEGEPLGIRVFCIAPGAIETPMLRGLFDEKAIPPQNTLSPDDIARAIVSRVRSPDDFTSGETVPLPSP